LNMHVELFTELIRFLPRDREEKIFLVSEVLIDRSFSHVRFLGNLGNARVLKAILAEDFYGGLNNQPAFGVSLRHRRREIN
jgi:hypothetical protein